MGRKSLRFGCLKEEKGAALISALIIVLVVSMLGGALLALTSSNFKLTGTEHEYQAAYYIAEAGINYMIAQFHKIVYENESRFETGADFFDFLEDSGFVDKTTVLDIFQLNKGEQPTASVTVNSKGENDNPRAYTIESVGKIGNSTRTVRAEISVKWGRDQIKVELDEIDDIFVFSPMFSFTGSNISGDGGTILAGELTTHDLNGGSAINVSNLYFGGSVIIDGGSASFGNKNYPGTIYVDGNLELWNGGRDVYGEVRVNGNFRLKDARIHGDVYVNGDVELGWTPQIHKNIYYTGKLTAPANYRQHLLDKCIKVDSVESFTIPKFHMEMKDSSWYMQNGYTIIEDNVSTQVIPDNAKLVVDNFYSEHHTSPKGNVVIISNNDIEIKGWRNLTGVLIAPYGQVKLNIASFSGVIISKEKVVASGGGWTIVMRNLSDFFTEGTMPINIYHEIPSGGNGNNGNGSDEETKVRIIVPIRED